MKRINYNCGNYRKPTEAEAIYRVSKDDRHLTKEDEAKLDILAAYGYRVNFNKF